MPVEIKELVIRAVVQQKGERSGPDPSGPAACCKGPAPSVEEREALVAAAVKEVLRILRASKER
jgi:Family of unknown function (DUF5908)